MKKFIERWLPVQGEDVIKPEAPDGERIYAIGDIHGSLDLLRQLHEIIQADASNFTGKKTLVYLGDYIDRGEHSREVIELLSDRPLPGFNRVHLLGNHEQSMLDFLQHPRSVSAWLGYGGRATLKSYGVSVERDFARDFLERVRDDLVSRFPQRHREFFLSMKLYFISGNYCFVHAGIRPGIPLQEQSDEDLLWIREDFTRSKSRHDHIIVHGHSITTEVDWNDNRIGIDTGAFHTGVLTCLVLENDGQRLLQTGQAKQNQNS